MWNHSQDKDPFDCPIEIWPLELASFHTTSSMDAIGRVTRKNRQVNTLSVSQWRLSRGNGWENTCWSSGIQKNSMARNVHNIIDNGFMGTGRHDILHYLCLFEEIWVMMPIDCINNLKMVGEVVKMTSPYWNIIRRAAILWTACTPWRGGNWAVLLGTR